MDDAIRKAQIIDLITVSQERLRCSDPKVIEKINEKSIQILNSL